MCSEQPCIEPSQIIQPSGARAAPSWLGPPIRLLRSCPVFDALGVGREALRLGVGWLWCGGLHGSRCRHCRACCGFGPWQSGDAPVDYVDDSHVHVAAAGRAIRSRLATYAIHLDREGRNPHAHILVANRRIDPRTGEWARLKQKTTFALDGNGQRIPVIDPETGVQKVDKRNRKQWKRVTVSENPLGTKAMLLSMRESWADVCNGLLPEGVRIDHRSLEEQGIDRVPTIHEGYASREMEKRGGRGDLCEENRRIQALNRLLDALRAMIGRLSDQAQGILTAVKRRQRPSGAPQAPSSPEPAERPQERPQARETPPQAPQEPPKPIRTKKALTDKFKTRLDERLAENERKQAEKQAEPDMEETWDLSDPADPLNIGMGWGTGGHGLGL